MTHYVFYRKQQVIATLERSDVERARLLMADGYSKMDEEINAASAQAALRRLADIRHEEHMTEHAFATGSVFSAVVSALFRH